MPEPVSSQGPVQGSGKYPDPKQGQAQPTEDWDIVVKKARLYEGHSTMDSTVQSIAVPRAMASGNQVGKVNFVEKEYTHMLQKDFEKNPREGAKATMKDVDGGFVLIKLGGSIITNKYIPYTFREAVSMRLAREIRDSGLKCALVHGAGSFGHFMAEKFEMSKGYKYRKQIPAFAQIQKDVRYLNLNVVNNLLYFGVDAVSISTSNAVVMKDGKVDYFNAELFESAMNMGLIPVGFGDIVFDRTRGFSICSADQLMVEIARKMSPSKAIFVLDTDGVMTGHPKDPDSKLVSELDRSKLDELERTIPVEVSKFMAQLESGEKVIEPDEDGIDITVGPPDVTGGLFSKLAHALEIASIVVPTYLVNGSKEGRLLDLMSGKEVPSTRISR
jgi:isopentenyl phosphate kinase